MLHVRLLLVLLFFLFVGGALVMPKEEPDTDSARERTGHQT
jgi:hypothetical protein